MPDARVIQSALASAGPHAAAIERLWWFMFWVAAVVFVVVMAALAGAVLLNGARRQGAETSHPAAPLSDRLLLRGVVAALGITVVVLFVWLIASIVTSEAVSSTGTGRAVSINLTGQQWSWHVEYEDAIPSRSVTTANEIHIPVGRPVVLKVTSRDVIHSFWVPNLNGKRDLIPGYTTALWLEADRPGVYRGQCAEFCGQQHAHMALYVTAEPEEAFNRWLDHLRQPAAEPSSADAQRGRDLFLATTCTQCHTIRGTVAGARLGPDLTHIASRGSIGAGTLSNTPEHLVRWIADPQEFKPGNRMPPADLGTDDVRAIAVYLGELR
jgi:cytochrome c oxidase subunit 2